MGRRFRRSLTLTLLVIASVHIATATTATADAAELATNEQFKIPLADGTTANAIVLPAGGTDHNLVLATPAGQLLVYRLTSDTSPTPPPTPVSDRCKIAIIEDPAATTFAIRQVLAAKPWRNYVSSRHDFLGLLPADLIDPTTNLPPPKLATALATAKGKPLPTVLIFNQADGLVEAAPLPTSAKALLELFQRYPGTETHDPRN